MSPGVSLAAYAANPDIGRGRRFAQKRDDIRNEYQRDRDRIVHSSAFRRLMYKTQVFANHEGDLFRSRLTHSLEVAQLGRSIGRALLLHEDLIEAIALAHDFGHTPFGHAGQRALDRCMQSWGGFEHNYQSLRVVDHLEEQYPDFPGLNLCFETREGILKHCSSERAALIESAETTFYPEGGVASRFITKSNPTLEAQVCNFADEIAYTAHDIDDGLRSGLLTLDGLRKLPFFEEVYGMAVTSMPTSNASKLQNPVNLIRRFISRYVIQYFVKDLIEKTRCNILKYKIDSPSKVRESSAPLVQYSDEARVQLKYIKSYLFRVLYRHPKIVDVMSDAENMVESYFYYLMEEGHNPRFVVGSDDVGSKTQLIADYISGMTDRYLERECVEMLKLNPLRRAL